MVCTCFLQTICNPLCGFYGGPSSNQCCHDNQSHVREYMSPDRKRFAIVRTLDVYLGNLPCNGRCCVCVWRVAACRRAAIVNGPRALSRFNLSRRGWRVDVDPGGGHHRECTNKDRAELAARRVGLLFKAIACDANQSPVVACVRVCCYKWQCGIDKLREVRDLKDLVCA